MTLSDFGNINLNLYTDLLGSASNSQHHEMDAVTDNIDYKLILLTLPFDHQSIDISRTSSHCTYIHIKTSSIALCYTAGLNNRFSVIMVGPHLERSEARPPTRPSLHLPLLHMSMQLIT